MVSPATAEARIRASNWLKRPDLQAIFALLDGDAGCTRAVGGIVRDTILGVVGDNTDIDLATEILPEEVMARARSGNIAAYPTGIAHGTVTLRYGEQSVEVTTLRQDILTDGRHAVVRFGNDWARDAARRDFTINALYADRTGALFDPLGAVGDLDGPRVRFIGDPDQRIAEDYLRVYRFFRFSASHGGERFDSEGLAASERAAKRLGGLAPERVGAEIKRMLGLPKIAVTLKTMVGAGVLDLPEATLARLKSYGQSSQRAGFPARLALILVGSEAEMVQARWRLSNEEIGLASAILAAARLMENFKLAEAAYRFPSVLENGLEVAGVLTGWTEAGKAAVRDQLEGLPAPNMPVSGKDLLAAGMNEGPELGRQFKCLETAWIESGFTLDRAGLLALLK